MLRSRFFWKLFAGYAALILATVLAAGVLCTRWIERESLSQIERSLREKAAILLDGSESIFRSDPDHEDALQERVTRIGRASDTRITLIRVDGRVLADSQRHPRDMDDHSLRPEVRVARETLASASTTRYSDTVGREMMYVAVPMLLPGGELAGFIRTSRPLTEIDAQLARVREAVAVGGALAVVLAFALGAVFARRVTGSMRRMTEVAESMAAGDYHRRVRATEVDELGRLARAFDTMAEELERHVAHVDTDRNRLLAILAGMAEGVVAIDREERIVHMNRVAQRLLRASPANAEGTHIWEATRQRDVRQILAEAMASSQDLTRELESESHGGEVIKMHASPLVDGQSQVVGAVVVLNDVTELRRLEAVRRDFVANVSHELKTPLTAIRGLVETILDDPEMPEETRLRFLQRVDEQNMRLSAIVTDLLTISRLEAEGARREREVVDLRALASESVARLSPGAESKGTQLVARLGATDAPVYGDQEGLRQVIDNLVDNAVKYTPEGGRVEVRLSIDGDLCRIEVEDTGIGIEPVDLERIFERFYRVDKARSRELGGTGLGLAIVKHVALDAGGTVSVESAPGVGSTFCVELPLAR